MALSIARSRRLVGYWTNRVLWLGNCRPPRMLQRGREVDAELPAHEKLYMRCRREWVEDKTIKPAYIHFPDQSVNRDKYSKPADVLLPDSVDSDSHEWIYWGVAGFFVGDIPENMRTGGDVEYRFTAEHDPYEDNYAHTELRVYKNQVRERYKKKINTSVKKKYRTELAKHTWLIVPALV